MEYSDYIESRDNAGPLTGSELFAFSQGGVAVKDDLNSLVDFIDDEAGFVQTVSGDGVDNTDPQNPVITIDPYTYPFPQFTTATSTTAYTGTTVPAITAYATGQKFQVKIHATSTGAATLNLNGLGAKKVFTNPTTQSTTGNLLIDQVYILVYDEALDAAAGGFLMVGSGSGGTAWDNTTSGLVERSTTAEAQAIATQAGAGTATGLSEARTASEVGLKDMLIQLFNTAVTWVAKMTFTAAPRFNSTTASQFLTVDSNKDLTSVAAATQAEMITGTDNTKVVTPLSVENKGSVKLRAFSNNATGSSTIDCQSQDTCHIVYTTTVTGAITIALSNDSNLQVLNITIPITGSNIAITTPSTTRSNRASEVSSGDGWYQSTKILQVSSVGTADTHELSFKRKSTGPTFELIYNGPSRA